MAERSRHLSVVRTEEDRRAAEIQRLSALSTAVPSKLVRAYDWDTPEANALFRQMNVLVAYGGATVAYLEDLLDMVGLGEAYMQWLGRQ